MNARTTPTPHCESNDLLASLVNTLSAAAAANAAAAATTSRKWGFAGSRVKESGPGSLLSASCVLTSLNATPQVAGDGGRKPVAGDN